MPKIKVNDKEIEFQQGMTLLQACELAGEEIPRFCYHERLKIAGNCRMCLVEVKGGPPKPAASCAMPAAEGMEVYTNTPMVKKAREGVMEFMLINHPLDCPICDQGGECDLQDQSMAYGKGESRYCSDKRSVKDKYMGPLIKTHMTRCIHCARCVRFLDDVAGVQELGMVNRGEHVEVSTYVEKSLTSELSGNIIDLCPVGALTSKPYAFTARSWELTKTDSIDVLDAVGSNIRVDSKANQVMRILPRLNEDINEEWLDDKSRFSYDGLKLQRLDRAYVKSSSGLQEASLEEAFDAIRKKISKLKGSEIAAIAGDMADCESMLLLKKLMTSLGSENIDCRADGALISNEVRSSYLFNSSIAGIDDADYCLLIGANPRYEAAILNIRLRRIAVEKKVKIDNIGAELDFNYDVNQYENDPTILEQILANKNEIAKNLKAAKKPLIIIGNNVLTRKDSSAILAVVNEICDKYGVVTDDWNGYNILHKAASRVGGLDIGFLPGKKGLATDDILKSCKKGSVKILYLLGEDNIDFTGLEDTFIIYQGHHGDKGAKLADVILPGAAYTEKDAIYVNLEGRAQEAYRAVFPPGDAIDDWLIIKKLADNLKQDLPYNNIEEIREELVKINKNFANIGELSSNKWEKFGEKGKITNKDFTYGLKNYYMNNVISKSSSIMAKCVEDILGKQGEAA